MAGKRGFISFISVPKAIAAGVVCGVVAVLCWAAFAIWPHVFVLPYVAALAATALCGFYVLLATLRDSYRNPRPGVRIRPIRGFDVVAGLLLAGPATWALWPFFRVF